MKAVLCKKNKILDILHKIEQINLFIFADAPVRGRELKLIKHCGRLEKFRDAPVRGRELKRSRGGAGMWGLHDAPVRGRELKLINRRFH